MKVPTRGEPKSETSRKRNMEEAIKTSEVSNNNNVSASKRSMLKTAWIATVVVAVTLPRSGYAANLGSAHSGGDRKHDKGDHKDNVHLKPK